MLSALVMQSAVLVTGVLGARILGVEDRGRFALLTVVALATFHVSSGGLPLAVTYHLAAAPQKIRAAGLWCLRLWLVQSVFGVSVLAAAYYALFRSSPDVVRVAALATLPAVPAALGFVYGGAVLQGVRRFVAFNITRPLPPILQAIVLCALFVFGGGSLMSVSAAWVGATAASAVLVALVVARSVSSRLPDAEESLPKRELAAFGLRGFVGSSMPMENFRLDQLVVGLFLSPYALGLYAVAWSFMNLTRFVAEGIGAIAYPQVASTHASERRAVVARYIFLTAVATTATFCLLEIAVGRLIPFFFGEAFAPAVHVSRVLLIAALFLSYRRIVGECARGLGAPGAGSAGEAITVAVFVPLAWVLVPRFGLDGAATAVIAGAAAGVGVSFYGLVRAVRRTPAGETSVRQSWKRVIGLNAPGALTHLDGASVDVGGGELG